MFLAEILSILIVGQPAPVSIDEERDSLLRKAEQTANDVVALLKKETTLSVVPGVVYHYEFAIPEELHQRAQTQYSNTLFLGGLCGAAIGICTAIYGAINQLPTLITAGVVGTSLLFSVPLVVNNFFHFLIPLTAPSTRRLHKEMIRRFEETLRKAGFAFPENNIKAQRIWLEIYLDKRIPEEHYEDYFIHFPELFDIDVSRLKKQINQLKTLVLNSSLENAEKLKRLEILHQSLEKLPKIPLFRTTQKMKKLTRALFQLIRDLKKGLNYFLPPEHAELEPSFIESFRISLPHLYTYREKNIPFLKTSHPTIFKIAIDQLQIPDLFQLYLLAQSLNANLSIDILFDSWKLAPGRLIDGVAKLNLVIRVEKSKKILSLNTIPFEVSTSELRIERILNETKWVNPALEALQPVYLNIKEEVESKVQALSQEKPKESPDCRHLLEGVSRQDTPSDETPPSLLTNTP